MFSYFSRGGLLFLMWVFGSTTDPNPDQLHKSNHRDCSKDNYNKKTFLSKCKQTVANWFSYTIGSHFIYAVPGRYFKFENFR